MKRTIFAAMLGVGLLTSSLAASAWTDAALPFRVDMGGAPIGEHSVRFEQRGDELHAFVDIKFDVGFAFLTLYEYEHSNHEVWRDGRLLSIDTRTNDDGETFTVKGEATADGFRVLGSGGELLLPADVLPSSYWNPATVKAATLLDTQTGLVLDAAFAALGAERVSPQNSASLDACRFRMTGDLDLDVWYDDQGRWVKMAFSIGGNDFEYQLLNDSAAAEVSAALSAVGAGRDICPSLSAAR